MRSTRLFLFAGCLSAILAAPAWAQGQPPELPEGPGKADIEALCASCHHPAQAAVSSGYTREGWQTLIAAMIDLSADQAAQARILDYLSAHYPPSSTRAPTLATGAYRVSFKDWVAPTLGQRPRDPVEGPDGTVWWVGQVISILGRLDPKTGAMKEYPLDAAVKPHSVNVDRSGQVWVLGNGNGTLLKFDPQAEKFTEIKLTDPEAKDPHTAEFDRNGIMWFTLQQSNRIGRFDLETGAFQFAVLPTPKSRPYGIQIAPDGTPWVSCLGSNCVVKVDPATMALTEVKLPEAEARSRRLAIAPDGMIYYVNSSQGRLGRLDPATGAIKEWSSPSGAKSHPYAIAFAKGAVWFNESAMRPDALVRFDPRTEKMQSWAIPSGPITAGIIRHMRPNAAGDLWIHQGSTNRIGKATLGR